MHRAPPTCVSPMSTAVVPLATGRRLLVRAKAPTSSSVVWHAQSQPPPPSMLPCRLKAASRHHQPFSSPRKFFSPTRLRATLLLLSLVLLCEPDHRGTATSPESCGNTTATFGEHCPHTRFSQLVLRLVLPLHPRYCGNAHPSSPITGEAPPRWSRGRHYRDYPLSSEHRL
jgi:hypothetical protein